ncbi:3-oxoacyl-(acyl-carrier-protein) synthase III [Herbaspirillum sp. YR522]|nr:3-oxoacyl-(acyl-carrier-protein) synthase III [Herbaspirillum sp. YR522]
MLHSRLAGINLRGVVAAVPANSEDTDALAASLGRDMADKIAAATGIRTRHLAPPGVTACDLGQAAARELLDGLGWTPESVDLLVVVTQTPDHPLPGNAPLLQHRLGLRNHCGTLDINSGCSGFVDGLWTAASLLAGSNGQRALLIVGDTTSQFVAEGDRNTRPLFGDAVAAIALEGGAGDDIFIGVIPGVDGSGAPYLNVLDGAARKRLPGQARFGSIFMDGPQVFAFTLRQVPKNIAAALALVGWSADEVDHLILHQANESMIRHLANKSGFTPQQMVLALAGFGNTSSASIPLAMASALAEPLTAASRPVQLLMSGFGVGWRWASAVWRSEALQYCRKIEVATPDDPQPGSAP